MCTWGLVALYVLSRHIVDHSHASPNVTYRFYPLFDSHAKCGVDPSLAW